MRGLERARFQAQRSLKRRMGEKETQNPSIIAKVGNGAGTVVVPGRSGWVYVRLHGDDNQLTEAKLGIPLDTGSLNDAWVRVKKGSPRKASYYVVEEFITSSTGDPTPPPSGAPTDASYVTAQAEPGLSAEKVLGPDVIMRGASKPAAGVAGRLFVELLGFLGYGYRKQIPITGAMGAGTNYQIKIKAFFDWWANWIQEPTNPIISPSQAWEGDNIYSLTVLYEDSTFRGWWGGFDGTNDRVGYGWSSDGKSWNKYAGNPILNIGAPGAWDDLHVNDPSVVKVGSTYYMFYTGCRVALQDEIGLVTAANPEGPWTKQGTNPVLAKGYSTDEYYVARPTVIYEDGKFKMWYDGRHQSSGNITGIYYAESADGIAWTRKGSVLSGNFMDPEVRRKDLDTLLLVVKVPGTEAKINFYEGSEESWVLKKSLVSFAEGWNPYGATTPGLIEIDGNFWLYYGGITTADRMHQRVGLAKNIDGDGYVNLGGHSRADFGDVRFMDDDGETDLDYWMQEKVDSDYAIFWVEVSDDLESDQSIYIYYGKADATTTSDGEATFLFFDDFPGSALDLVKWDVISGSVIVANSIVTIQGSGATADEIRTDSTFAIDKKIITRVKHYQDDYFQRAAYMYGADDAIFLGRDSVLAEGSYWITRTKKAGAVTTLGHAGPTDLSQWYEYVVTWKDAQTKFHRNGVLLDTHTTNVPIVSLKAGFLSSDNNPQLDIDWIALGKFVSPEPFVGTSGSEETVTQNIVWRDNGISWDEIARGEAGIRLAQLFEKSHPSLTDVTADQHHANIHAAAHKSGGEQPLDVKELVDSEGRLLTGAQKTDLTDGGFTSLHQHAGGGGAADSVQIMLTNRTGGERTAGDVVVTDPGNDESFIGTAVAAYQGKVLVVAGTVADLTGGPCWERGGPFDVKVINAVSRNEFLCTSATIYRAEAAPSITGGGVFAIALSPNVGGEGTVKALFLDAVGAGGGDGGGTTIEIQEDDVKVADADIVNFEGGGGKVTDEGGGKVTVDITPGAGGDHYETYFLRWFHRAAAAAESAVNNFPVVLLDNGEWCMFAFHLPSDFSSIAKAVVMILPDATEQIQYDIYSSYGAVGEGWGAPSESSLNITKNVTLNKITECDVIAVLTGVAAGDYVGLNFSSDINTLQVVGLMLRFKTT